MTDIFISYAQVDDQPLSGAEKGWVSCFVENLRNLLNRNLGRDSHYKLWMDHELRGNQALTTEIFAQLQQAKLLVLFLSPGYKQSQWCRDELDKFNQRAGSQSGRIFVVELDDITKQDEFEILGDLLGYRFWYKENHRTRQLAIPIPIPEQQDYFNRLDDLAEDLADKLIELRQDNINESNEDWETVYLAPVADTLKQQRGQLRRVLRQYKVRVLPTNNRICLQSYRQDMDHDLAECSFFIQLLDAGSNLGIPLELFKLAKEKQIKTIQWRERSIDLDLISDKRHQELLLDETVIASNLTEFQQQLIKTLESETPPEHPPVTRQGMIFINAGQEDMAAARCIAEQLKQQKIPYVLPIQDPKNASPKDIRKDLEQNLSCCDTLLQLYDVSPLMQIREHLLYSSRMCAINQKTMDVFLCQHQDRPPIDMLPPYLNLVELQCTNPFDERCNEQFLAQVASE